MILFIKSVVSALILFISFFTSTTNDAAVDSCFEETLLEDFTKCWSRFIPGQGSLTESDWLASLPSPKERQEWQRLVQLLLSESGACQDVTVSPSVQQFYKLKIFVDGKSDDKFCILYETSIVDGRFIKGWGLFVVPYKKGWSRTNVHYSVAHPISDGPVELQGAAVFQRAGGRSLLITGFRRDSSQVESVCQSKELRTDAAHDNTTMFHSALQAIQNWQFQSSRTRTQEACTWMNCAFLQFHGKADTSCTKDTIFLSTGYSHLDASVYSNPSLPVNRLKLAWRRNAPSAWTASTPNESGCVLAATKNIFGRLLNGVHLGQECAQRAEPISASGYFIHVEQAMEAREKEAYDIWATSVLETFTSGSHDAKRLWMTVALCLWCSVVVYFHIR